MPLALEIGDLHVEYGGASALTGVTLAAEQGRVTGITGNNGAGKTTLLHAVMGLVKPRQGSVRVLGDVVTGQAPRRMVTRGVALVPEGRHVFADQTVTDNLRLGYVRRGLSFSDAVDRALIAFPELKDHLGRLSGALSGGQQQMVAVARAVVSSPSVLLLDEPFLGLAPVIVDRLRDAIVSLASTGMTVVVSDAAALRVVEFCDHSFVLRVGEIVSHGTRDELTREEGLQRLLLGGE